ncbi:MAG TPA: septal ring lytic transglycosylase RlpA family protein [Gaiellaceae bacterium]|nr:septal ring lytic transglycosylase RlpA family protein [Gaiellaceae bacterium]
MGPKLLQRLIALAAVALLAGVVALAATSAGRDDDPDLPARSGDYSARAGSRGPGAFGKRTACGGVLRADTEGVAHPVLPCGARIYISYGGTDVLTQIVDRGPYVPGREFDLTDALARRLGLRGVQNIRWSYARAT